MQLPFHDRFIIFQKLVFANVTLNSVVINVHCWCDGLRIMVNSFVKPDSQHNLSKPYEQNQKHKIVFFPQCFPELKKIMKKVVLNLKMLIYLHSKSFLSELGMGKAQGRGIQRTE